jgi:hypothetical protein
MAYFQICISSDFSFSSMIVVTFLPSCLCLGEEAKLGVQKWRPSVHFPTETRPGWGSWGRSPSVALMVTRKALRKGQGMFKWHRDHLGATTWPFFIYDWPALGIKARRWNL